MKMKKCLVEKSRCILNTSHMVHIRPVDLQHPKPRMVIILMIRMVLLVELPFIFLFFSYGNLFSCGIAINIFHYFPIVICSHEALLFIFLFFTCGNLINTCLQQQLRSPLLTHSQD